MSQFIKSLDQALDHLETDDPRGLFKLMDGLIRSMPKIEAAHKARKTAAIKRDVEQYHDEIVKEVSDVDLRIAVMDALQEHRGFSRAVAAERTNTPNKLFALAEEFNLI